MIGVRCSSWDFKGTYWVERAPYERADLCQQTTYMSLAIGSRVLRVQYDSCSIAAIWPAGSLSKARDTSPRLDSRADHSGYTYLRRQMLKLSPQIEHPGCKVVLSRAHSYVCRQTKIATLDHNCASRGLLPSSLAHTSAAMVAAPPKDAVGPSSSLVQLLDEPTSRLIKQGAEAVSLFRASSFIS